MGPYQTKMSHEQLCIWTGYEPAEIWPLPWGANLFSFPLGYERLLPLAPGKPSVVLNLHEVSNSYESGLTFLLALRKEYLLWVLITALFCFSVLFYIFVVWNTEIPFSSTTLIQWSWKIIPIELVTLRSDVMGSKAEWFSSDILMWFSVLREHQVSHRHCKSWILLTQFLVQ